MSVSFNTVKNEEGFVLVISMVVLIVLTLIGIVAMNNSNTERMISGNDKIHKETFYQADGGTEMAQHVVFHNLMCRDADGFADPDNDGVALLNGSVRVYNLLFAEDDSATAADVSDSVGNRWFSYYPDAIVNDAGPHTNFLTTFTIQPAEGDDRNYIEGYHGPKGPGASGAYMRYTIASQHAGIDNSQSLIQVRWRIDVSVVDNASTFDCIY